MTVRVYRSSDASAPVLSGQVGALMAIFHACLVTGYGALSAAGWAREFTTTNKAVFRPASGNRFRLRVDDTGAQESRVSGYETMSDSDTGTGQFPTSGQVAGGMFCRKSNTADATARPWVLVASATAFYFFPDSGGTDWLIAPTVGNLSGQLFFGDIVSFKSGDAYGTMIVAAELTGTSACRMGVLTNPVAVTVASTGQYVTRAYYQTGASINVTKRGPGEDVATVMGNNGQLFPDPIVGGMLLTPVMVIESGPGTFGYRRGVMPGLYNPLHLMPGNHADQIVGTGESLTKTFLMVNTASNATMGRLALDISDSW